MALTELTRVCTLCHRPLPDPPAAPVCAACGHVAVAHYTSWQPVVRWWLLSETAVNPLAWVSEQEAWERRLRAALLGRTHGPNPWGLPISTNTSSAELYVYAHERALAWKAAGSPIAVHVPLERVA